MWDIDWKRLDMIQTDMILHCEIEKKKKYGHKGEK